MSSFRSQRDEDSSENNLFWGVMPGNTSIGLVGRGRKQQAASKVFSVRYLTTLGNWRLTLLGDSGSQCTTQRAEESPHWLQELRCLYVSSQQSPIEGAPGGGDSRFPRTPSLTPRRYDGIW